MKIIVDREKHGVILRSNSTEDLSYNNFQYPAHAEQALIRSQFINDQRADGCALMCVNFMKDR